MECPACHYIYEEEWNRKKRNYVLVKGDENFIRIMTDHNFVIVNPEHKENPWLNSELTVELYACPKCKCVVMSDD